MIFEINSPRIEKYEWNADFFALLNFPEIRENKPNDACG
jgi:hypothetical protein